MRGASNCRAVKSNKDSYRKVGNDPAVEGVFRIVIQRNLKEMVDLPELKVWNMLPRTVQARMIVRVRRYGFFFTHDSEETLMRCVLTRRNYLIVYAKEKQLKGYAVKLSLAEKINIACARGDKGRCNITIKWQFGEISLTMLRDQIADWRSRILEAFEGTAASVPDTREVGTQTMDHGLHYLPKKVNGDVWGDLYKGPSKEVGSTTTLAPSVMDRQANESKKEIDGNNSRLSAASMFTDTDKVNNDDSSELSAENGETDEKEEESETLKTENETSPWPWSFVLKNVQAFEEKSNVESKLSSHTSARTLTSYRTSRVRRSISSPALDMNKFNNDRIRITSPPVFGPRTVTFPKRSISRIERPISSLMPWVPPQTAPWCTVVKRYDFPKEDAECSNC